jgi:hypothetical protein
LRAAKPPTPSQRARPLAHRVAHGTPGARGRAPRRAGFRHNTLIPL